MMLRKSTARGTPELYACDWLEQIGSYLKYGLLDADVLLDVNLNLDQSVMESARALQLSGCVLRAVTAVRETLNIGRQKAVCGRRRIQEEPIPGTCLECGDLKGVGVGPGTIFRPAIFRRHSGIMRSRPFRRQHCHSALITRVAERSAHGVNQRRARQTCWRADFQREADDPHDVFRIILTHDRSPFHVQPVHTAIVVDDAEVDR